ncbi:MAG: MauE/DoxX family redox-associated membrane protein [Candidatus Aminicenantales bacterium]
MSSRKLLLFLVRLVLGGTFVWAGILKIADPLRFAEDISNYRVFPRVITLFLALVLPWVEVLCGVLLVSGVFFRASALILSGLLVTFLVLISVTIVRGINIECGCFGSLSEKVGWRLVLTDSVLLLLTLTVLFSRRKAQT